MPHKKSLAADRAKRILALAVLFVWLSSAPTSAAEKAIGSITGVLEPAEGLTSVTAVNRAIDKPDRSYVGLFDAKSGKFTIPALTIDSTYDVLIETKDQLLEGVNLSVPRSDYEEEQPLAKEDVATIREKVFGLNQFEDKVEILTIEGNIQHAAILLNKVRTKPFVNSQPGEIIWRAELWHYQRPEETWLKAQDELFIVLHRERLQGSMFEKRSVTFDPALGGIKLTEEEPRRELGRIELPQAKPGVRLRKKESGAKK